MKAKIIRLPVLFILLSIQSVSFADTGPEAAMKQFVVAFNSQDAEGVAAMFHDDGKLLPAGQAMITGTKEIQGFWQGAFDAGLSAIEKTPIEIIISGDLAVETSSYFITFGGNKIAGKDTLVWRRGDNDKWLISTDIWARDQE